jgi:hypothetical protein
MNNHGFTYGPPPPSASNLNGASFIDDPSDVHSRYPDISSQDLSSVSNRYVTSWSPNSVQSAPFPDVSQGYAIYQPQTASTLIQNPAATSYTSRYDPRLTTGVQGYDNGYIQAYAPMQGPSPQSFQSQANPFMQPAVQSGQSYSMPPQQIIYYPQQQQQQQQQQPNSLPQSQPLLQPQGITQVPNYPTEFDPYSSPSQGWDGATRPQTSSLTRPQSVTSPPTNRPQHPRDYIRNHKADLDSWDTSSWKQVLGMFERLRDAWEQRRLELSKNANEVQMRMQFGYSVHEGSVVQQVCFLFLFCFKNPERENGVFFPPSRC